MADNLFDKLSDLTIYERKIGLARPEDIVDQEKNERGEVTRLKLREGAKIVAELSIRALTDKERQKAEREVNAIPAPPLYKEEFQEDGAKLKARTKVGYDEEDPDYLEKRREGMASQRAMVALMGCKQLRDDTDGDDLEAKIEKLRNSLDEKIITFIAQSVWAIGYAGGDAADFFSEGASESTPS